MGYQDPMPYNPPPNPIPFQSSGGPYHIEPVPTPGNPPVLNPTNPPAPGGGDDGGGDTEIPPGTYPYTDQWSGLPSWAVVDAQQALRSLLGGMPSNAGGQLWSRTSRPFDWWENLPRNRDWFSGELQGTRNQLLEQLHQQLRRGTTASAAQLAARGLPMMTSQAAPAIYNQALSSYADQMAQTDRWAAEQAAQLTDWMAEQDYREKTALANALSAIMGGIGGILGNVKESWMHTADPLAPYRLLLGLE